MGSDADWMEGEGAMTDATNSDNRDLDDRVEEAVGRAKAAADAASDQASGVLDDLSSSANEAIGRATAAASDAASQAKALAADAADDAAEFIDDASDWIQEKYRENPALVLGLAAAAGVAILVGIGAIVRAIVRS